MGVKSSDVIAKNGKLKEGQEHRARNLTLSPSCPPRRPNLGVGRGVGGVQL